MIQYTEDELAKGSDDDQKAWIENEYIDNELCLNCLFVGLKRCERCEDRNLFVERHKSCIKFNNIQ